MERYLVTAEFYVYAENDKDAKTRIGNIQYEQRMQYDNQYCATRLESAPFGGGFSDKNLIEGEIL